VQPEGAALEAPGAVYGSRLEALALGSALVLVPVPVPALVLAPVPVRALGSARDPGRDLALGLR